MSVIRQGVDVAGNHESAHVAATEARATLPALLDRVERGEEITLTRHGRAVAVIVHPDTLRARRLGGVHDQVAQLDALMEIARTTPSTQPAAKPDGWADQRVDELRADREARR